MPQIGQEKFAPGRRAFLGRSVAALLGLFIDERRISADRYAALWTACTPWPPEGGVRIATLPLDELEAPDVPLHRLVGDGLDARLFTDLSSMTSDTLVTANDRFFVRTAAPRAVRTRQHWRVDVRGLVESPRQLTLEDLAATAAPMGTHLIECAGNARSGRFGLISAAQWTGVPFATVIDIAKPRDSASHVVIRGVDDEGPAVTSVAGASWVFTRDQLAAAFLATGMNGEPVPLDHGAPVRLIVPGWYGCACIKWVDAIEFTDGNAPATTQMKEFAARTHQRGVPELARQYEPASIDLAAMPVRVEKWRVNGRLRYEIIGIAWGGQTRTAPLQIRTNPREPFVDVNGCPPLSAAPRGNSWTMWTHVWEPSAPGVYQVVLKSADPEIRTRRLDLYYYTRTVRIGEV